MSLKMLLGCIVGLALVYFGMLYLVMAHADRAFAAAPKVQTVQFASVACPDKPYTKVVRYMSSSGRHFPAEAWYELSTDEKGAEVQNNGGPVWILDQTGKRIHCLPPTVSGDKDHPEPYSVKVYVFTFRGVEVGRIE